MSQAKKPSKFRRFLRAVLKGLAFLFILAAILFGLGWWYFHPSIEVREAVVYTQRNGADLTYDIVKPADPNGAAVLLMVSGSWKSGTDKFEPWLAAPLVRRGFTVFAVSHLSQPKARISEIVDDVNRAVRHIRHHAADYGVDPQRFGVTGGSSGGHLSLMLATLGGPGEGDGGAGDQGDPVERESSAVQAAAVFFPVTDLVDLGPSTQNPGDGGPPMSFVAGFGFDGRDDDRRRIAPVDMEEWKDLAHELSPIHNISDALPPILIHHGDADTLVPLDQSQRFIARAAELGIDDRIELVVHPGAKHGWITMILDVRRFGEWFERKLAD